MSELGNIYNRLTALEVQNKERWKAHDEKSDIIWNEIKSDIKQIFKMHDSVYTQMDSKDDKVKGFCKTMIGWVLGIPVTIATVLGIVWTIKKIWFT